MIQDPLQISYSLDTIANAAQQFWQYAHQQRVWAFSGQLGAGKTTFIHAVCDHLGVPDAVSSPTFALINEYHFTDAGSGDRIIYHMDWYRLRDAEEAIQAGMEDALTAPDALCFVEWPEKAPELLQMPHLWIEFDILTPDTRTLTATLRNGGRS